MAFQLNQPDLGGGVDRRALPADAYQTLEVARLEQALNTQIKRAAARFDGVVLLECEELLVANKPAISGLSKQGNVFLGGDDEGAFGVPHRT